MSVDVWKWGREVSPVCRKLHSGFFCIYSKKVSLIILAKMSIQDISAEDRVLVSVVDQQDLAHSLAAVCSKKRATESNSRKSDGSCWKSILKYCVLP